MALRVSFAHPLDTELDEFCSGDTEVDNYFRGRAWFDTKKNETAPPTYRFVTADGDELVGYASAGIRKCDHPNDGAGAKAKYLLVFAVGVCSHHHGVSDPAVPTQSLATSLFDVLDGFAHEKRDCVGLALWVRAPNARAIRFYTRLGFVIDPAGPVQRLPGPPHLTMRKLFPR